MSKSYSVVIDARSYLELFSQTQKARDFSGAEIQMSYLVKGFAQAGVHVILLGNDKNPEITVAGVQYCRIPKYLQGMVPKPLRVFNLLLSHWPRQLVQLGRNRPIIYLQAQDECLRMMRSAKKYGVKIVRWVDPDMFADGLDSAISRYSIAIDNRIAAADALVAQSVYQKETLASRYGRDSQIIDSMHGSIQPNFNERKQNILWVGRCASIKRPEAFFELAARLLDCSCVMVMPPGDEDLYRRYAHMASTLPNVTFVPGESDHMLAARYRNAAICVNTAFTEVFSNTFIELMLSATPIAALTANPDGAFVEDNGGFCAGGDLSVLANHVRSIVSNPLAQARAGRAAYDYAAARFDNELVVSAYLDLFERVIGNTEC